MIISHKKRRIINTVIALLLILILILSKPAGAVIVELRVDNLDGLEVGQSGYFYFNVTIGGNEKIPIANFSIDGLPHINGSPDGTLLFNLSDTGTIAGNNVTKGNYVIELIKIYGWIGSDINGSGYLENNDTPPYLGNGTGYQFDDYSYGYGYSNGYGNNNGYGHSNGYGYSYGYGYGYANSNQYTQLAYKITIDTTGATAGTYDNVIGKVNTGDSVKPDFSTSASTFQLKSDINEWIMTLSATDHVENAKFGINGTATNKADFGQDIGITTPPLVETPYVQMALIDPQTRTPMQTLLNRDHNTWNLKVTINRLASTTISWDPSDLPSDFDMLIDGMNMRKVNSLNLTGDSLGAVVLDLIITNDTIPPVINNIKNTTPTYESISILWNTDEDSTSSIQYCLNGITRNETNSTLVTSHNITLTGLNDDTNYSYYITSTDRSGNSNTSSVQYFATSPFQEPNITSYSPSTPVFNLEGTQREFHINIDQISNVTWYLDGMNIGTNNSIYTAKYTNLDAVIGYWNVTASVTNVNGTDNQTWLWIVRGPSDSITVDADPSTIVANDEELSTITATIKDVQGNNVIDGTIVSFSTNRTSNDTLNTSTAITTNGNASITVKGNKAGVSCITAENGQASGSVDVTMIAGPVATISNISGMGLTGVVNTALSAPFVFQINDRYYNPITGVDVNFTVIGGNGASASTSTATSDTDGRVSVTIALGNTQGTYGIMCEINGIPTINNTIETTAISKTPPDPVNLTHTTGNYWVKYTWSKGRNDVSTDSYNVSLNGTWTNGTSATFLNTSVGSGGWANISVWAYHNEDNGYLSTTCISDEMQAPIRPGISSYGPQSPVSDTEEATRMFNIAVDQVVDVSWYINGTHVQTSLSTQSASYTNLSAISGIWNVSAIISNTNGTDIQTWIWNVREATVVTIDLSLDNGWNMISIPVRPLDSSVDSVFADVNMFGNNIYEYQSNGYNVVSVVEPKIGYWVFSNDSRTITITGKITTNNISNLDPGWNMIGLSLNPSDPSISSVFASVNMFGKDVYTYNNTKSSYEKVTEVEPKVGYWIFSFGSNRIIYEGTTVTSRK
jgi:hypothetical protein